MKVADVMTRGIDLVDAAASVREAATLMAEFDVGAVFAGADGKPSGVVTDRDLAIRLLAEGKSGDTAVGEIASKDVVTVDPQQTLEEATRLMAEHQLRRLPVCEEDGKLVGILAQADVAQSGQDTLTGETVQQISK